LIDSNDADESLIDKIYEAAVLPEFWSRVLGDFATSWSPCWRSAAAAARSIWRGSWPSLCRERARCPPGQAET